MTSVFRIGLRSLSEAVAMYVQKYFDMFIAVCSITLGTNAKQRCRFECFVHNAILLVLPASSCWGVLAVLCLLTTYQFSPHLLTDSIFINLFSNVMEHCYYPPYFMAVDGKRESPILLNTVLVSVVLTCYCWMMK